MPSYQQGRFLPFALEGLVRQTYSVVETAVFDNVSTDSSSDVLRLFEGRVSRIVRQSDRGQADALRRGFLESDAGVLGWLNADDMILPDALETVTAIFRDHPDVDVVYGDCAFLNESGQFLGYFQEVQDFSRRDLLNFSDFIPQPSTFFRRRAYEAVGGIDSSLEYAMDWDLWCRMARAGARFMRIREVLAAARLHSEAKTQSGGFRRTRELCRVNMRHAAFGIPFVATAQVYHRHVRKLMGPFAAVPRWVWTSLLGAPRARGRVQGIGRNGRIAAGAFRVRFPVFRPISKVSVYCPDPDRLRLRAGPGPLATVAPAMRSDGIDLALNEATFLAEIDLLGHLSEGAESRVRVVWQ